MATAPGTGASRAPGGAAAGAAPGAMLAFVRPKSSEEIARDNLKKEEEMKKKKHKVERVAVNSVVKRGAPLSHVENHWWREDMRDLMDEPSLKLLTRNTLRERVVNHLDDADAQRFSKITKMIASDNTFFSFDIDGATRTGAHGGHLQSESPLSASLAVHAFSSYREPPPPTRLALHTVFRTPQL